MRGKKSDEIHSTKANCRSQDILVKLSITHFGKYTFNTIKAQHRWHMKNSCACATSNEHKCHSSLT